MANSIAQIVTELVIVYYGINSVDQKRYRGLLIMEMIVVYYGVKHQYDDPVVDQFRQMPGL